MVERLESERGHIEMAFRSSSTKGADLRRSEPAARLRSDADRRDPATANQMYIKVSYHHQYVSLLEIDLRPRRASARTSPDRAHL